MPSLLNSFIMDLQGKRVHPYIAIGLPLKERHELNIVGKDRSIEAIQLGVCEYYKILPEDLSCKRRNSEYMIPKKMSIFFFYKYTKMSLGVIATYHGLVNHATVLHHKNDIQGYLDVGDIQMKNTVDVIDQLITKKQKEINMTTQIFHLCGK